MKKIIDKIAGVGSSIIALSGGEPTLREDIFELISYICKKDFSLDGMDGIKLDLGGIPPPTESSKS